MLRYGSHLLLITSQSPAVQLQHTKSPTKQEAENQELPELSICR
jgi:hypothetical protein